MKKNILISTYDMEIGGIERSLINMLESLDYDKYNVDLFVFHHTGDFFPLIPPQVNVLPQLAAYTVFRKSIVQCLKEGHYAAAAIRVACKWLAGRTARKRRFKEGSGYVQMQLALKYCSYFLPRLPKSYDLAISYAWPHDIIAKKVSARRKVAWIHTDFSELEIDSQLDLAVWSKFDSIASVSEEVTRAFVKKYPSLNGHIMLFENITSPAFIKKMAEEELPGSDTYGNAFNIVSVGRLSYVKGFDMAVRALKILHDKGLTHIKWRIVGYGGFEPELRALIAEHRLEDSFLLLGKKTNPYPYIKACDLYVQPSRYEGKAVTVTEAKILGKPILITRYPTSASQVDDGIDGVTCGLSAEGIAEGIEMLYRNHEMRKALSDNIQGKDFGNAHELRKLERLVEG